MRIGVSISEPQSTPDPVGGIRAALKEAARDGYVSAWLPHIFDVDALTLIAAVAHEVPELELGTAVVPTYPRHPGVMAQQALTAHVLAEGRMALGIGLSHRRLIETCFAIDYHRPADHMEQYLEILVPLLEGKKVEFHGDLLGGELQVYLPVTGKVPVLLAAMFPRMLRLAGSRADGTILWMTGAKTIETHIAPLLFGAAEEAGRPRPRIVCLLPVCVTADPDAVREEARIRFDGYEKAPSYAKMLEIEGAATAADIALIGSEAEVRDGVAHLESIGVSDFVAVEVGPEADRRRTREVLLG